ncbi:MAG: DUF4175 family protein [Alphaproteobacteria bacterium]|nr:MAG: DUF4175 family protein [Alphaproteobacteria bacterium]
MSWGDIKYAFVFFFSGLGLLAERFWNAFWPALSVLAVYMAAACLNVFSFVGPVIHAGLLFFFVAAFSLAATRLGARFRFPRGRDIRRAIEIESDLRHRPLEAMLDRPVEGTPEASRKLWDSYQERLARLREEVKTYRPESDAKNRDPYYVRYGAAVLLVLGILTAQHDALYRIRQGLHIDVTRWLHMKPVALDAWITPPEYTHENPVFLATTQLGAAPVRGPVNVPIGSILKVRLAGYDAPPHVTYAGAETPAFTEPAPHSFTMEMPLDKDGELKIRKGWFRTLGKWMVRVTPDEPPKITLLGTDKADRAALKIKYQVSDDYGIRKMYGVISATGALQKAVGNAAIDFEIPIPEDMKKDEQVHVTDLASHPWAGSEVNLTLYAIDAADHESASEAKKIMLPEREFTNPTAQKIIAERKRLIWYDNLITERLVIKALADIASMPQNYKFDQLVFLGLDMAAKRLMYDGGEEAVQSVVALLWDLAIRVEDGGLSLAARELSDALQRLSEGLKDKSLSKEQLQALMDDVQQKMREYAKTLAQEMQQRMREGKTNPQLSQELADKLMKKIDMGKLMEQMKQLGQGTEREQMEKMAQFLKNSVDRFDPSKLDKMQEAQRKAFEALNKLQKLIERQQSLLDQTNKMQPKQQNQQQQQDQQQQGKQQGQEQSSGDQGQQNQQQQGGGNQGQQQQPQSGGQQGQQQQSQSGGQQGQQQQSQSGGQQGQQQQSQSDGQQQGQQQQSQSGGQQQGQQGQSGQEGATSQQAGGQQPGQQGQGHQGQGGQQQAQPGDGTQGMPSGSQQGQSTQGAGQQPGGDQQTGQQKPGQQGQGGQQPSPDQQAQQQAQQGSGGQGNPQQQGGGEEKYPKVRSPKEGAAEQGTIREKLGDIMRDLGGGMSSLPKQFSNADQAMKAAQNALGNGDTPGSAEAQRQALENLQKAEDDALEQLAKSMQMMIQMGFMPNGQGGGFGDGFDPLGRESGEPGNGGGISGVIKLPDEKERRRVQQILEELRSRSNEYQRPKIERDYIDRLLETFD